MRTPAAAFAWEYARITRWGWIALGAWLGTLLVVRVVAYATGDPLLTEWGPGFAFAVFVPGTLAFYAFVAVFTYG